MALTGNQSETENTNSILSNQRNPSTRPRFLGYQDYTVQDLLIRPHNILYRLARYKTPQGKVMIGKLPLALCGKHFGVGLRSYIIYQHYYQRVTQPLLQKQLNEWGIEISTGQISRILSEDQEAFHKEKSALLRAGIHHSTYLHVDDTGSRHKGVNGYCTHIGNESFAWFSSTRFKNRINFIRLLQGDKVDYKINTYALNHMEKQGLTRNQLNWLEQSRAQEFSSQTQWEQHLKQINVTNERHIRIITEGALLGALQQSDFPADLVIISDDAGQFNILIHALCWIHTNRVFERMRRENKNHVKILEWIHEQIWEIYSKLKRYKDKPQKHLKKKIEKQFDTLCKKEFGYLELDRALERLAKNKKELLLVLERPDIPLHNNLSERDIREYVIKRKISGSTRSENGRRCRDTFLSLFKTCKKQKITVWNFLNDRLSKENKIPYLPNLLG